MLGKKLAGEDLMWWHEATDAARQQWLGTLLSERADERRIKAEAERRKSEAEKKKERIDEMVDDAIRFDERHGPWPTPAD